MTATPTYRPPSDTSKQPLANDRETVPALTGQLETLNIGGLDDVCGTPRAIARVRAMIHATGRSGPLAPAPGPVGQELKVGDGKFVPAEWGLPPMAVSALDLPFNHEHIKALWQRLVETQRKLIEAQHNLISDRPAQAEAEGGADSGLHSVDKRAPPTSSEGLKECPFCRRQVLLAKSDEDQVAALKARVAQLEGASAPQADGVWVAKEPPDMVIKTMMGEWREMAKAGGTPEQCWIAAYYAMLRAAQRNGGGGGT